MKYKPKYNIGDIITSIDKIENFEKAYIHLYLFTIIDMDKKAYTCLEYNGNTIIFNIKKVDQLFNLYKKAINYNDCWKNLNEL